MLPNGVNRKKRHSFQYEVATGVAIQRSFTSPSRSRDRMVITVTRGTVQYDHARLPHKGKTFRKAPALCLHLELARLCRCCCSAFLSRETMAGWRNRLVSAGNFTRAGLGILLIAIGELAITRLDKSIETVLVAASPQMVDRSDDTVLDRRARREGYSSDDGSG